MSDLSCAHTQAHLKWCLDILFGSGSSERTPAKCPYDLLAFCQRQQIGPLLFQRSELFIESLGLPWALEGGIEAASLEQWQRSNRIRFELNRVRSSLAAAGIEWVLLKGLALAHRFFGSPDARACSDLDVLVHRADLGRATDSLTAAGYKLCSPRLDGGGPWRRMQRRALHHVELAGGSCEVELHHCLRSHPALHIPESQLWSGVENSDAVRGGCRVLSDENVLLTMLLALHADVELGVANLKSLVDVDAVLTAVDASTDWQAFFARRRAERTLAIAVNGIALTTRLLRGQNRYPAVDDAVRQAALARLVRPPVAGSPIGEFVALFDSTELAPSAARRRLVRNKLWAHRQYHGGLLSALWSWASSLPIRLHGSSRPFQNFQERR